MSIVLVSLIRVSVLIVLVSLIRVSVSIMLLFL